MIESGNFFHPEDLARLASTYVDEKVKVFITQSGFMLTDIDIDGKTIKIARDVNAPEASRSYGHIAIPGETRDSMFSISKRPYGRSFLFYVWDENLFLGYADGYRFDLALAHNLGVSDKDLVTDMRGTKIDPKIPQRVAEIVFEN